MKNFNLIYESIMKLHSKHTLFILSVLVMVTFPSIAQISMSNSTATTNPKGLVDMQNSTAGIVYPRFALTSTPTQLPRGLMTSTQAYMRGMAANGLPNTSKKIQKLTNNRV